MLSFHSSGFMNRRSFYFIGIYSYNIRDIKRKYKNMREFSDFAKKWAGILVYLKKCAIDWRVDLPKDTVSNGLFSFE
jgi:hypothetical protein